MAKPSILFAYGASSGGGGDHEDLIRAHYGNLYVLDWRDEDPNFYVPPQLAGYMGGRFRSEGVDRDDPREAEGALGGGEWIWNNLRPEWRRSAFRGVYGVFSQGSTTMSDALNYLHNGKRHVEAVIPLIDAWAATVQPPRIAIGLSLGGLILADALAEMNRRKKAAPIELLVTVGSQAGIIFLSDAMAVLRRIRNAGPPPFTPWLNIWNRDDYLSWPLKGSLPDDSRIRDRLVWTDGRKNDDGTKTPDLSFPEAHSAYFRMPRTYEHIAEALD